MAEHTPPPPATDHPREPNGELWVETVATAPDRYAVQIRVNDEPVGRLDHIGGRQHAARLTAASATARLMHAIYSQLLERDSDQDTALGMAVLVRRAAERRFRDGPLATLHPTVLCDPQGRHYPAVKMLWTTPNGGTTITLLPTMVEEHAQHVLSMLGMTEAEVAYSTLLRDKVGLTDPRVRDAAIADLRRWTDTNGHGPIDPDPDPGATP